MMPMLFWRSASRRMPSTFARRVGSRLPMPLSSTLMLASRVAVASLPPAQAIGAAEPVDRRPGRSAAIAAHRRARALPTSSWTTSVSSAVIVLAAMDARLFRLRRHAVVLDGNLIRIGFSRAYSSATSAVSPATRPTMKRKRAGRRREAQVVQDRRERAVDVHRQRLDPRARPRPRAPRMKAMPSPATPSAARHVEQHLHARIGRVHAVAEARQPALLADRCLDRRAAPPAPDGRPSRLAPRRVRPRSAPCSWRRRRRARRRSSGRRRRSPRRSTAGCPTPPAARRRRTARPAPWSATPIRMASSSRRSPGDGSRPRCSSTIGSVNVALRISDVTSCPRIQMFVASDVAIAVRQGSMRRRLYRSVPAHAALLR